MNRLTQNTKNRVFINKHAQTMSHANGLARSSPSGACGHMRREIFALHCAPSLLVLHVNIITIGRYLFRTGYHHWMLISCSEGEYLLELVFLLLARRHQLQQLCFLSCWLVINLYLGHSRRSAVLWILSGRSHTWFQPVEVNN